MRVLFLLDSLGAGGAEQSTAVLLPHLQDRGLDVSVILLYQADEGSEVVVRAAGIPVEVLGSRRFLGRVRELRKILRTAQPDILHTALYAANQVGRIAAVGTNTRLVSSLVTVPRSLRPTDQLIPIWKSLPVDCLDVLTAWTCVDCFHAVTDGVGRATARSHRAPRRRIVTVERGRDPLALGKPGNERRQSARDALGIPRAAEVVIGVGRQEPQKDFTGLLAAVALLLRHRPDVHLILAGRRGADSGLIDAALESEPILTGRVHLLGHRTDVGDLLCASDVFVLNSEYEGAAGVVLEAMHLHAPIVATELEGLEGILVDGRNALTIRVGDPGALAHAIERSLDDPEEAARRADEAATDFEDRFTIDQVADRMVEMYGQVVGDDSFRLLRRGP